jgi:hypothetical protein
VRYSHICAGKGWHGMGITQQDLEQAFSGYKDQYSGKKEDYFALLYLTREFEKTPDQVARHIAFGQETPEGINAFHIDVNRRNLYLFQFQWSVRYQTLLRKKTARAYGDEGKAAGCVPLAALLFEEQFALSQFWQKTDAGPTQKSGRWP